MRLKKQLSQKKLDKFNVLYIIESIMFFVLCFFFVPKIDDIIFYYNEFFQFTDFKGFLNSVIYYGNGRFLGNGLGIIFSKIPEVFYFVEFVLVQIFCFIFEKLTKLKNAKLYALTVFLLQSVFVFLQIESWLCGFINYFIPVILLTCTLLILKNDYEKEISSVKKALHCTAIVLLGIAEQLFIEHNAIINFLIAVTILVTCIFKKKKVLQPLLLTISNAIGLLILFLYKYYVDFSKTWVYKYDVSAGMNTIINFDSFTHTVRILGENIVTCMYIYFTSFVVYTIFISAIIHIDKKTNVIKHKKLNIILMILYYPATVIVLFMFFTHRLADIHLVALLALLFLLNIIGVLYSFIKSVFLKISNKLKLILFIILIYSLGSMLPFIIRLETFCYRGYFFAYMLMCLFVFIVVKFAKEKYNFQFEKQMLAFGLCIIAVYTCLIPVYVTERKVYNYNKNHYKTEYYLPASNEYFTASERFWSFAEDNIDHEYVPYKEFKEMQK